MDTNKYNMDSNKSLGYSPLGMISHEESQYDFIADRKPIAEPKKSFDDYQKSPKEKSISNIETDSIDIDSETNNYLTEIFGIPSKNETDNQVERNELSKKSASYYMSAEIIERLRNYADKNDETYSSVAEKAIKTYLNNL